MATQKDFASYRVYAEKIAICKSLLTELKANLREHEKAFKATGYKDWGYVGDVTALAWKLENCVTRV